MAAKSHQAKKRQLLKVLNAKREVIQDGTHRLQDNLKELPGQAKEAGAQAKSKIAPLKNVTPGFKKEGSPRLDKMKLGLGNLSTKAKGAIGKSEKAQKLQAKLPSIPEKAPVKPILIGLGGLLLTGILVGKGKKKKKLKQKKLLAQAKEHKQVAKYGAGILFLKWLLSASQPAVKHYLTKKAKKKFIG